MFQARTHSGPLAVLAQRLGTVWASIGVVRDLPVSRRGRVTMAS